MLCGKIRNGAKIKTLRLGKTMSNLQNYIDNLADTTAKLSWISSHCQDAGLKLLLEEAEHELLQAHEYFRYHADEGILQEVEPK